MTEAPGSPERPGLRPALLVTLFCTLCYFLMLNGGVDSADSEIVFRTAKSLADSGSWAIKDLERWPGFGVATGADGRRYSVFGPGEAVALVPFVMIAERLEAVGWYRHIPVHLPASTYAGPSHGSFTDPPVGEDPGTHAMRLVVSVLYLLVGAAAVFLFWTIIFRLTGSAGSSSLCALLFGIGSLQWAYASTLFSESLVVALSLGSFVLLLEPASGGGGGRGRASLVLSGLLLGAAIATHVTAVLLVPFYGGYVVAKARSRGRTVAEAASGLSMHLVGVLVFVLLLAWHNAARFGNILETGRSLDPDQIRQFGYGYFVAPWQGMYGLMLSWGKGLLLYSPAVIAGLLGWKALFRNDRILGFTAAGTIMTRWLFIASRFDWAGGYCLGPRLLVPVLPFALIPFAFWLAGRRPGPLWRRQLGGVMVVYFCTIHQFYLQVGDVFHFYVVERLFAQLSGINVFRNWLIHFDPEYSPVLHILASRVSPFLWASSGVSTQQLFSVGVVLFTLVCCGSIVVLYKQSQEEGSGMPAALIDEEGRMPRGHHDV